MRNRYRVITAGAAAAAVLGLAACSSGGSAAQSSSGSTSGTASGSLNGGGKTIVMFTPTQANTYIAGDLKGAREEAAKLNYKLTIYQNNFDQSQEDQQVQQFLASGVKPAAIIWWPSSEQAGINDTRLLSRIAPIIQINQGVSESGAQYVKAYAGVSDDAIGTIAGQEALKARTAYLAAGNKLHGSGGNLLEFSFNTGYEAGVVRSTSFLAATKSAPFTMLRNEPALGTLDAADGFSTGSQIVPEYRSKGIDFVYAQNLDMAGGVVKALEQNGLTPGKNVEVIAGNCSGNLQPLENGSVYSAVVQPPIIEGELAIRTAAQYLATGKVIPGSTTLAASPTEPAVTDTAPYAATYLPVGALTKANLASLEIWGLTGTTLCSGN
jgi:ABC-type sugar transport system substrate-binding protein